MVVQTSAPHRTTSRLHSHALPLRHRIPTANRPAAPCTARAPRCDPLRLCCAPAVPEAALCEAETGGGGQRARRAGTGEL